MQAKAPRGTFDVMPGEIFKWHHIEKTIKETAEIFGYSEIRTPIFEHTELFERGVGDTTDIVSKEMYTFKDRSNRSLTLRPENTASCVRAFIEHSVAGGILPAKWYYLGPMFRYDRPQAGRYRQFHQFGVEAFGSNNPQLDAEIISLLLQILTKLGLQDYELHLNSVGCPQCREVYRKQLVGYIGPFKDQLCADCLARYEKNPLRVLDCKVPSCQEAIAGFPYIYDYLCADCLEHYSKLRNTLDDNQIDYVHDNQLVRGLDYYTNTAFEVHIPQIGAQSAIGGGGRYNGLVKACGGPNIPGIGFAMGLERLLLALESLDDQQYKDHKLDVFLAVMDGKYEAQSVKILTQLRQAGIKADKDYNGRSGKAQMKYADKLGARGVILLGEDEMRRNIYTLRNMDSKEQIEVPADHLIDAIKKFLI
ncbi:Histidine-tRNA ligase/ATP phosphoribosyltransferase regulatory subunit [Syntrophomonas zehnderi OL-4]|uniref:Histidine--tRNA ligase n=1 Tax=Syntrophomonas zehnderi OL-4 TaxID=690567 RepID=A0A0E3W386_9FIRM|nr:histidine--tRNA ligase [Syntrophomonas zehnderi]CFX61774.1 Histidine-tRNA ligase/ATP phosphoribosyltransferase regulatory subunit [Syntrophomonas zehnderi OL-4]